jgi:hypothetical protein
VTRDQAFKAVKTSRRAERATKTLEDRPRTLRIPGAEDLSGSEMRRAA